MKKIELTVIESTVLSMIPKGIERKASLKDIESVTGLSNREVQAVIHRLIRKNVPICAVRGSADGGIYIPTNEMERQDGLIALQSQAEDMLLRVKLVNAIDLENWHKNIVTKEQIKLEV